MSSITTIELPSYVVLYNTDLGVKISLAVKDNAISFTCNSSSDWTARKNKVAITRWLLAAWQEITMKYPKRYYSCYPHGTDGKQEMRIAAYTKMGFKTPSGYDSTMVWGNVAIYNKECNY